jgi:hypothetical protein
VVESTPAISRGSPDDSPRGGGESPHASATLCYGTGEMAFFEDMCSPQCQARVLRPELGCAAEAPWSQVGRAGTSRVVYQESATRDAAGRRVVNSRGKSKASFVSDRESGDAESGIGVIFRRVSYGDKGASVLKVIALAKDGPAAKEGTIKAGMHLTKIGDVEVQSMEVSSIAPLILGPRNSQVTLTLKDPDSEEDSKHYVSTRSAVYCMEWNALRGLDLTCGNVSVLQIAHNVLIRARTRRWSWF